MIQKILIENFEVSVKLGCYPEEKESAQPVFFTVELIFDSELRCARTDDIGDAVDYVEISEVLKKTAQSRHFSLVESLNFTAAAAVTEYLKSGPNRGIMRICTRKIRVPVEGLKNGVAVSCEIKF